MAVPRSWLASTVRSAARRSVRTLTNNPTRASENFSGFKTAGYGQRGIRRLMKRDLSKAQGTPAGELLTGTDGTVGKTGARGVRVIGHTESKQTSFGTGQRVIKNRGVNRTLKRR